MKGYIHSIESFGTVDGPGVRFVVFFQGCPMRCLYCHNPDTWTVGAGMQMSADEVLAKMLRNIDFYKTGGLTATGGEPLLQLEFLTELFSLAKDRGIHTCLDTSGITFSEGKTEAFDRLLSVTDLVMLDIKHIDDKKHKELTGHSNKTVLNFARYLNRRGVKMRVRQVLLPEYTDTEEQLLALGDFLSDFDNLEKIEILPYHTLGRAKYENLGIDYPLGDMPQLTDKDTKRAFSIIEQSVKH